MKLKRKWTMGIIATVSVLILAACGGESTPTSPIAPRADLVSPMVAAQTPTTIPMDIDLYRAGDPGISWHNHDEENEA